MRDVRGFEGFWVSGLFGVQDVGIKGIDSLVIRDSGLRPQKLGTPGPVRRGSRLFC